jgi:shikimate dehydrogenase
MHNAAFRSLKINAEYRFFEKSPQELEDFLSSLKDANISGLNVTIPYKEAVIPFLDEVSEEAKLIGAVNTIKVLRNRLQGHNTDGAGFLKHISEDLNFTPRAKRICVMGAGGASRAISVYLCKAKPKSISIYDIDKRRLAALARHLRSEFKNIEIRAADSIAGLNIGEADLLLNATPVGMSEADPCLVDKKFFHKGLLVYDLIYNPQETKLLARARDCGAKVSNGLGMLLYQGMLSFEIWTGKKAPKEVMRKALLCSR